jgi:hypothetical protein
MLIYIIKCLYHISIGVFLFLAFRGLNKLLNSFFEKKNYSYPSILTIYFFSSYFFFVIEKKLLIFFTTFLALYYLYDQLIKFFIDKKYLKLKFLTITLIYLSTSLILGKIFHGPEENYTAFGLIDTYYYTSLIYQDDISYLKVRNNNIFGFETSIFFNIIAFLGNQFASIKYFDPFNFISISLLIFSILSLKTEIINLKINIKASFTNLLLIIFVIFSLPYPLYFFESPILLVAMPIFPHLAALILNFKNLKICDFFFLAFSILISKLAFFFLFFLTIIYNIFFSRKNIIKKISILLIVLIFLNHVISLENIQKFYFDLNFNQNRFDFLNLKMNFLGLHSVTKLFVILFLLFLIKKKFLIFYFIPSLFLYIFFPSSSPGQIFYILLLIILTNAVDSKKLFKTTRLNMYFSQLIFFFGILFIGLGFFFKIDFYLYLLYLIIFLFVFNNLNFKIYKILNFFLIIIILLSLINSNFRQDNVLTLIQKEIYIEIKNLTPKNDIIIFSDLNLTNEKLIPPWGLYSSISERQFYISSFYGDYMKVFSDQKRDEMYKINNDIIFSNKNPKELFKDLKKKSFYILTNSSSPQNQNTDIIFKNKDFLILKFK